MISRIGSLVISLVILAAADSLQAERLSFSGSNSTSKNVELPLGYYDLLFSVSALTSPRGSYKVSLENISGTQIGVVAQATTTGSSSRPQAIRQFPIGGKFRIRVESRGLSWKMTIKSARRFTGTRFKPNKYPGLYIGDLRIVRSKSTIPALPARRAGAKYFEKLQVSTTSPTRLKLWSYTYPSGFDTSADIPSARTSKFTYPYNQGAECNGPESFPTTTTLVIRILPNNCARLTYEETSSCPDGTFFHEIRSGIVAHG